MSIDVTPVAPPRRRAGSRPATVALLAPLLVAVIAGLVALWPASDALAERAEAVAEMSGGWFSQTVRATLVEDLDPEEGAAGLVEVRLDSGEVVGAAFSEQLSRGDLRAGTRVVLMHSGATTQMYDGGETIEEQYWIQDVDRGSRLMVLAAVAAVALLAAGRWRGLRVLLALAAAAALSWSLLLPHLLTDERPLPALVVTAIGICLAVALAEAGFSRRAALLAWGTLAGAVAAGAIAWLVAQYLTLTTATTLASVVFGYLDPNEVIPAVAQQAPLLLGGVAGVAALATAQVRLLERRPSQGSMGLWQLVRGTAPALQRIVLIAGLLATAFLIGPALARRLHDIPGVGMQYLADLDLGLAVVLTAVLAVVVATPVTGAVLLALDRRIDRAADGPGEPAETGAPAGSAEPAEADSPAEPVARIEGPPRVAPEPGRPGADVAPVPASPQSGATAVGVAPPESRSTRHDAPGEPRPAPRRRPEADYRRPE